MPSTHLFIRIFVCREWISKTLIHLVQSVVVVVVVVFDFVKAVLVILVMIEVTLAKLFGV